MATATQALQNYAESFQRTSKIGRGQRARVAADASAERLRALQRSRLPHYARRGLALHQYFARLPRRHFELCRNGHTLPHGASRIEPFRVAGAACQLVFVDGRFAPELSRAREACRQGVTVRSLAAQIAATRRRIEPYLGHYLDIQRDAFSALNTAFIEDGAFVHVGKERDRRSSRFTCCLFRPRTMRR